ncbi:ABC transporter ATP-binding protein [Leptothermofonsia sichuanensis E412]|uniref:ABC transporter ATP-binding protein n=1 Tax=Leptothermofonsia sichuanensis TaxID=2917832 RepID=UPI001CA5F917|nr:ABC transporter ATP-binding protein [Leptothermofonsia sichuanensis]QZZ21849.1 ABC transporter ATP-binding protein [Leptothermofonsia sichuanensis E412]
MSQILTQNQQVTRADTGFDVELRKVFKVFAGETVVRSVDLNILRGEFFSILGPSGCGKTTTLRLIAGFETPSAGEVLIQGQPMTQVPPYRRPVNTVFQSYALFNHLTVQENIAFGLRLKKRSKAEIETRVKEALNLVKMESFANRFPGQLSGGQQQRVALARALVNRPAVVLLDEPLGALDLKLRKEMQVELTNLHRELGLTFVMVTHDQEEALSLSDRIAVMNQGRVEQVDTPSRIYEQPLTPFVADFIGDTNLFPGKIEGSHPAMLWVITEKGLKMKVKPSEMGNTPSSGRVVISVRPERIQVSHTQPGDQVNWFKGRFVNVMYLGTHVHYLVELDSGDRLTVMQPSVLNLPDADTPIYVYWAFDDCLAIAT